MRLEDAVSAEQIHVVDVSLRDEALRTGWRYCGRKLTRPAFQLELIIDGAVFIAHPKIDTRIPKILYCIECEDIACFENVAEGGSIFSRRFDYQSGQIRIAPDR